MRKKIVAGNWKMNHNAQQTKQLLNSLLSQLPPTPTTVMVAPSFVNLQQAVGLCRNSAIEVIAQNMHFENKGAFTGEISAEMLKDIGVNTVIIGHSERRSMFGENDAVLTKKVNAALDMDMKVIFCIGETLADRENNDHFTVIKAQLDKALFEITTNAWSAITLAYEPVWAIGTGQTAKPEQIQEIHQFIRKTLAEKYNKSLSESVSILYGGSVKPSNAKQIFGLPDVDGALVGGASLNAKDFLEIISGM